MERIIFLVDIQSFFASIEKADNPSLRDKPIVVAGDPERRSGVILAACPLAKRWGVETAEALWEAQQKCPHLTVVKPRMQKYVQASLEITDLMYTFSDLVEPYSIDEQFIDLTHSLHLLAKTPAQAALLIQETIYRRLGVKARIGIGPNKVLAKMACDHFAKKNERGIAVLDRETLAEQLWPLPVRALFGVGRRLAHHLERMGIRTIGHLAQTPVTVLKKRWGINGERLWLTANGIDHSPVSPASHARSKSIGHHMTLPRDYIALEEIKVILLELCEEVSRRSRLKGYVGHTISVGVRGARLDSPIGFYRQTQLPEKTNHGPDLFQAALTLLNQHWSGYPIRSIGVTLSGLERASEQQLTLFDQTLVKKERLNRVVDQIKERYGDSALLRAVSLTGAGQARERAQKIGGHYK